jgi:hypothetical protein
VGITNRPQKVAFKPEELYVSPSCAGSFRMVSVSIGVDPQLVANGSLKCDLFPPDSPMRVSWKVARTSEDVVWTVTNLTGAAVDFDGMLVGPTVQ